MSEILKAVQQVAAALSKTGIGKDRRNQEQNYSYRGIDDYLNALSPLLAKHGIVIAPEYSGIESAEVAKTAKGNAILQARVVGKFTLHCVSDGSSISAVVPGEGRDSADKAINKAMSTAYKYMAAQVFCIPFVGMEDAELEAPAAEAPAITEARMKQLKDAIDASATIDECRAAYTIAIAEIGDDALAHAEIMAHTKAVKARLKAQA